MILYADCPVKFNRSMRLLARHMGYSLNQRGLFTGVVRDPKNQQRKTTGSYTQYLSTHSVANLRGNDRRDIDCIAY